MALLLLIAARAPCAARGTCCDVIELTSSTARLSRDLSFKPDVSCGCLSINYHAPSLRPSISLSLLAVSVSRAIGF